MINTFSPRITKTFGLIALTALSTFFKGQTFNWAPAGPIYNVGRARNMIVDKNNSQVLYVSATSGIFKSVNAGTEWYAINDQTPVKNISYLAQAADGTLYAGTGEGFLRPGQKIKAQVGTGLYKLSGIDLLLVASGTMVGTVINRIACNPTSSNIIALATNKGILISNDYGSTFTPANLPGAPTGTAVSGQDVKFDSNGLLYCSIGTEAGASNANTASKVYKSNASLSSFTNITPSSSVFLNNSYYGRIELAIAPSNNNVIYASCANKYVDVHTATLKGLFVSYDAGNTWGFILQGAPQLDPLSNGGTRSSGDYAHVITVNPANPDQLFFGGYFFYVFTRTGGNNSNPVGSWTQLGSPYTINTPLYLHENIHDIKIIQGSPNKVYLVTDAGVYRSIDMVSVDQSFPPSFQPFYKGLATGQFNSVSMERYPLGTGDTTKGSQFTPYSGFIGGTAGNGLTYFSGTYSLVAKEMSYLGGEVYHSEYSKVLSKAAYMSTGNGGLYRSTNIGISDPTLVSINNYTGSLNRVAPQPVPFANTSYTTAGTPFKLWESYGQLKDMNGNPAGSPDSVVFYNDTLPRYMASMTDIQDLTTKKKFVFLTSRPNKYALIDSVVIRTSTIALAIPGTYSKVATDFNQPGDGQTIYASLPKNYVVNTSATTILSATTLGPSSGPVTFTMDPVTSTDKISVTFTAPPFSTKTITQYPANATGTAIIVSNPADYYKVFATVYYKYKPGDMVSVIDENISTKTFTYSGTVTQPVYWSYESFPVYTVTSGTSPAVTNPTYVLTSNAPFYNTTVAQYANPNFTVSPYCSTTYSVNKYGTFTLTAQPLVYKVSINPFTYTIAANTLTTTAAVSYTLRPGNIIKKDSTTLVVFTVAPTSASVVTYTVLTPGTGTNVTSQTFTFAPTSFSISPSVNTQTTNLRYSFIVDPTVTTSYTLSQTTGILTQSTSITVSTPTYVLNPGNISKVDTTVFIVTTGTNPITYTIEGISSNPQAAANASTSYSFPAVTKSVVTFSAPLSKTNPTIKMPATFSARMAMILNSPGNTGNQPAVVVSKNPLDLNYPLNVVRVSQSGCLTDSVNGNKSFNTISIPGKPILLEWSKTGTELYYATNDNKLYRVSHITHIMDLSASSYRGKFLTDVFNYSYPPSASSINTLSPYRTTLVGQFEKPITSINISNDDRHVLITLNYPTAPATGTTGIVMYSTCADIRKSVNPGSDWIRKDGGLSNIVTYCSMMEKDDNKKVFVGTDKGIFYTSDITAGNWTNVNNGQLPNVQVFDIKQQTLEQWDCYNSGQIYVATNGRGIWTNSTFLKPFTVGAEENTIKPSVGNNLSLYPNPTGGDVTIIFTGLEGESAEVQVMDISGRVLQTEDMGKLRSGDVTYSFETKNLHSGVYVVNVSSNSGVKRAAKLVVTK